MHLERCSGSESSVSGFVPSKCCSQPCQSTCRRKKQSKLEASCRKNKTVIYHWLTSHSIPGSHGESVKTATGLILFWMQTDLWLQVFCPTASIQPCWLGTEMAHVAATSNALCASLPSRVLINAICHERVRLPSDMSHEHVTVMIHAEIDVHGSRRASLTNQGGETGKMGR